MARPTYLDEDTRKRITDALNAGCTIPDACAYGGIKERTYHIWRKRGEEYDEHLEGGGEIIDGEDEYRLFALEVATARSSARVRAVLTISKAIQGGDAKTALEFLARTDPANWGRLNRVEMTGAEGGPLQVADVTEIDRRLSDNLRKTVPAIAERAAGEIESGDVVDAEVVPDPVPAPTARPGGTSDDYEDYAWGAGLADWPDA